MSNYKIGLVVPLYQTKFIKQIIKLLSEVNNRSDLIICLVNDGQKEVELELKNTHLPENFISINLSESRCFAGANNAGWKHLNENFPELEYLGTINDDTIPRVNWLDALVEALKNYPQTALAMPIMETNEGWFKSRRDYATWKFKNPSDMEPDKHRISGDTFSSAVNGFCFVVKKECLAKVNYFDEGFKNGCEDLDLGIKLISSGLRLVVCEKSRVYHFGASSRYLKNAKTDLVGNHLLLEKKWGRNITQFNNIQPKTTAFCPVFNQEHFIEAWVRNAAVYADELLVMYSRYPWKYNKQAKNQILTDKTENILDDLCREFPKLKVINGEWDNETSQRNQAIKIARKNGTEWLLIVDTDEFYEAEKMFSAYAWMLKNKTEMWWTSHNQLIKNITWSVKTNAGNPKFQFALDLKKVKRFEDKRTPHAKRSLSIPENICMAWHFSYLMSDEKIKEKLLSFGHANEIRKDWLTEIWPNIKPGIRDFHPVSPSGWKEIAVVSVPEEIKKLFNNFYEQ